MCASNLGTVEPVQTQLLNYRTLPRVGPNSTLLLEPNTPRTPDTKIEKGQVTASPGPALLNP